MTKARENYSRGLSYIIPSTSYTPTQFPAR